MLSGFLSNGNSCLIYHLKLFDLTLPQQPPIEKVLKFNMSFQVLSCDFPGLRNLSSLFDLSGLCNLTGLNSL